MQLQIRPRLDTCCVAQLGPLSYLLETSDKQLWRRHMDQVKARTASPISQPQAPIQETAWDAAGSGYSEPENPQTDSPPADSHSPESQPTQPTTNRLQKLLFKTARLHQHPGLFVRPPSLHRRKQLNTQDVSIMLLTFINPRRACAARVTVVGSVCLSVCPCSNSLLDGLFVPQTIQRSKRVIRISLIERFSLKMLCCRDLSVTSIVSAHSAAHFLLAENEHAHYITNTSPLLTRTMEKFNVCPYLGYETLNQCIRE